MVAAFLPGMNGSAQTCEPQWLPGDGEAGLGVQPYAMAVWKPDPSRPQMSEVVVVGTFVTAGDGTIVNRVARWNTESDGRWRSLGDGLDGDARAATVWDPDADGPLLPCVVVGGSFSHAGGVSANRVAVWDGTSWHALGGGLNGTINALTTWDPDGDGPLPPRLIAGGQISTVDSVNFNGIAMWDGGQWLPLGMGVGGTLPTVNAMCSWDPDGEGPLPPVLAVGGNFATAGGQVSPRVATWNGTQWSALGIGLSSAPAAIMSWDADGDDGPLSPVLLLGGTFGQAGGMPIKSLAKWNGSVWAAVDPALSGSVLGLLTWDPDGVGPQPARLTVIGRPIFGGTPYSYATLENGTWRKQDPVNARINAAVTMDVRQNGGSALVIGGPFVGDEAYRINCVAYVEYGPIVDSIERMVPGFNGGSGQTIVRGLVGWDPDGDGPREQLLIAGGSFEFAGSTVVHNIASWDGFVWRSMAGGTNGVVTSLAVWRPGGPGPEPGILVAGGTFTTAGGIPAKHIAMWDGQSWQPIGTGLNMEVNCLSTWHPAGTPGSPEQLVAGGIYSAYNDSIQHIARWNGSIWHGFAAGTNGPVYAITPWDPDDDGPLPEQLYVGGRFTEAQGGFVLNIAKWNGLSFEPLGSGVDQGGVRALLVWDRDGPGGHASKLVVGGEFSSAGTQISPMIAQWDGATWLALNPIWSGIGSVLSLANWDPDGAGLGNSQLVVGGNFSGIGGEPASGIASWDGSAWNRFNSGLNGGVYALSGGSPGVGTPGALVAGGNFNLAGGAGSKYIARWISSGEPSICGQPHDTITCPHANVELSVAVLGPGPFSYQWTKDNEPIEPALNPSAATATLRLPNVSAADDGVYQCFVSNACGDAATEAFTLSVCAADVDCSGGIDLEDYFRFFNCFDQTLDCADLDGVAGVGLEDFFAFFNAWDAGC